MGVVIGRLDVIAAPPDRRDSADEPETPGPTPLDVERVVERAEARAARRRAD